MSQLSRRQWVCQLSWLWSQDLDRKTWLQSLVKVAVLKPVDSNICWIQSPGRRINYKWEMIRTTSCRDPQIKEFLTKQQVLHKLQTGTKWAFVPMGMDLSTGMKALKNHQGKKYISSILAQILLKQLKRWSPLSSSPFWGCWWSAGPFSLSTAMLPRHHRTQGRKRSTTGTANDNKETP